MLSPLEAIANKMKAIQTVNDIASGKKGLVAGLTDYAINTKRKEAVGVVAAKKFGSQLRSGANDAESAAAERRGQIEANAAARADALRGTVKGYGAEIIAGGSTNVGGNIEAASDAQDRVAKLVAEAAAARAAFDANRQAPGGPNAAQAAAGAAGEAAKGGGSLTTFDAVAAARGFGGGVAERTEQNTRQSREWLEKIHKALGDAPGLVMTA
jgi:hypothetical protein